MQLSLKVLILFIKLLLKAQEEKNKIFFPDLQHVMDSWLLQSGHPVIHIQRINETSFSIKQERFLFEKSSDNINAK